MAKSNGRIIYQGPSMIDGAPIVVVAVGLKIDSKNSKTGNMIQTHILRADIAPTEAIRKGLDSSICGDCKHRGDGTGKGRTCYVFVAQGPLGVWKTFNAGKYPTASNLADIGKGRLVRVGTYGDPAAVPANVWSELLSHAVGSTGYTHQWVARPDLARFCMASADSPTEALRARALGWRTFRVALPVHTAKMDRESICPASAEAGKKLTCSECLACNGTGTNRKGSIVIQAHGGTAVMANIRRVAA